ncbi:MAG: transcriptional repressor [Gammaproteobacteria bacterium]|nr:transcriptional repressor [Gammaproteobacteria bacterium]
MTSRAEVEATLRAHRVQPTPRRIEIGLILLAGPCHVSADQLLATLRRTGSRVSKATVYNTLKAFSRAGILREVAVDPARLVYDSTTTPHHHFLDEETGELTDIDPEAVDLPRLPPLPAGAEATRVELVIRVRRR